MEKNVMDGTNDYLKKMFTKMEECNEELVTNIK